MVYQLEPNSVYPIIDIIFKICLCTPATNCPVERTLSVLKRIKKDYLRNKTKQDRLQALAVLCSESEIALSFDYSLMINKFVDVKRQKNCSGQVGLLLLIIVDRMSIK